MRTSSSLACGAVVVLLALPSPALAYIDPGAGNLILQAVLGGAAGLYFVVRLYWSRLKARLTGRPEAPPQDPAQE